MKREKREYRFAKIPETILTSPFLTPADRHVYAILALQVFNTNIVNIGQRRLAKLCAMDRRTVRRSLERLAKLGHISTAIGRLSGRTVYQLNSPVFLGEAEQRVGVVLRPQVGVPLRPRSIH